MTSYQVTSSNDDGNGDGDDGDSRGQIEQVVLLDEDGRAIGAAAKHTVHHAQTPLHLAFSCYVFDDEGRLLVTQRALRKRTWPGAWTNTVCGHPAPGEGVEDAVRRRVRQEVGVGLDDLRVVLPRYRYRAVMDNGTVENEMCPVFVARTGDQPDVDPAEVEATSWVPWPDFSAGVLDASRDVSPWCRDQVRELASLGADPLEWAAALSSDLPPAARPD
jgi:isopentenyl-diphosphate delta-isomerase